MTEGPVAHDLFKTMLEAEIALWHTTYFMLLQQTNADFDVALTAADQALERFRDAFDPDMEEESGNVAH